MEAFIDYPRHSMHGLHRKIDRIRTRQTVSPAPACLQNGWSTNMAIQMVDMHLPTTDGRTVLLSRYTEPELDQLILLRQLKTDFPAQPSPRIASVDVAAP